MADTVFGGFASFLLAESNVMIIDC